MAALPSCSTAVDRRNSSSNWSRRRSGDQQDKGRGGDGGCKRKLIWLEESGAGGGG